MRSMHPKRPRLIGTRQGGLIGLSTAAALVMALCAIAPVAAAGAAPPGSQSSYPVYLHIVWQRFPSNTSVEFIGGPSFCVERAFSGKSVTASGSSTIPIFYAKRAGDCLIKNSQQHFTLTAFQTRDGKRRDIGHASLLVQQFAPVTYRALGSGNFALNGTGTAGYVFVLGVWGGPDPTNH
jgi:hypothetical protein